VPFDVTNVARYHSFVIRSFRSQETEKVWRGELSRRLPTDIQQVARRKLRMLNNAQALADLRVPPNNRLEALHGDRKGQYSIRINDQWPVCFRWQEGDAHDVEIVDYH
jgi:proteic killer suppression protein